MATMSYGWLKKLRASSRCSTATIALRNSPRWNCHLRLQPKPKREKLPQHRGTNHAPQKSGKSQLPQYLDEKHAPRERRQRDPARRHDCPGCPHRQTWQSQCNQSRFVAKADRHEHLGRDSGDPRWMHWSELTSFLPSKHALCSHEGHREANSRGSLTWG